MILGISHLLEHLPSDTESCTTRWLNHRTFIIDTVIAMNMGTARGLSRQLRRPQALVKPLR